ncbi:MAG: DUF1566 domain-containing protein [SAR324 cluster bacterium]|nr:DUF1566 domain-containing protein [SAR324 cluster bacterium]
MATNGWWLENLGKRPNLLRGTEPWRTTDWRLPNRNELQSLVDYSKSNPAIDTTAFSNTNSSYYWSSTANAYSTSNAWYVNFYNGYVYYGNKTYSYYVRCVRGGQ